MISNAYANEIGCYGLENENQSDIHPKMRGNSFLRMPSPLHTCALKALYHDL